MTRLSSWEPLHRLAFRISPSRRLIIQDAQRWVAILSKATDYPDMARAIPPTVEEQVAALIKWRPEFRALFYYRLRRDGRKRMRLLCALCALIRPPQRDLYLLAPEIGPGLFLQHAFATIVTADRIGSNCWINQQVTIGYTPAGRPVIGDNVTVYAGAKVLGKITIGDNVVIGANAVVVRDVPANCTVVGVPARIVKRDGIRMQGPLGALE